MPEKMLADTTDPQPIYTNNLIPDPQFEKVAKKYRDGSDQHDQEDIGPSTNDWSNDWVAAGTKLQFLGWWWFQKVDAETFTKYSIGYPPDSHGNKVVRHGMCLIVGSELSLAHAVTLNPGTVNVNFVGARNNWGGSGDADSLLNVILESEHRDAQSKSFQFQSGPRLRPTTSPIGQWKRYSVDFKVEKAGKYFLKFRGGEVISNSQYGTGTFITDIFLCTRSTSKPKVLVTHGAVGDWPNVTAQAHVGQYFAAIEFLFLADEKSIDPLRDHLVKIQLRDPANTGLQFTEGKSEITGTTDHEGKLRLPAHTLKAGSKTDTSGELVVIVDDAEIYRLRLNVLAQTAESGVAASVVRIPSSYSSGDEQNAISKTRFSRPLKVAVSDAKGLPATKGQITFTILKGNPSVMGYLSASPLVEWDTVSKTAGGPLTVSVNAGYAEAWLIGNYAGNEPMDTLTVTAQVKGKSTTGVSFTEHVWASNTAFNIDRISGNEQHLKPGDTIQQLKVKLEVRSTHHGVPHEWLQWKNNNAHDLRFVLTGMSSDSYHREDDQTVWTRTDANGLAQAPALERTGGDHTK